MVACSFKKASSSAVRAVQAFSASASRMVIVKLIHITTMEIQVNMIRINVLSFNLANINE
jgi:hypothetical protein